jgi:hypothetical protein
MHMTLLSSFFLIGNRSLNKLLTSVVVDFHLTYRLKSWISVLQILALPPSEHLDDHADWNSFNRSFVLLKSNYNIGNKARQAKFVQHDAVKNEKLKYRFSTEIDDTMPEHFFVPFHYCNQ